MQRVPEGVPVLGVSTLVGLLAGAVVGAFAGGIAALFVPEEFSRTGFMELVLIMAGAGAVAGLIQGWLARRSGRAAIRR